MSARSRSLRAAQIVRSRWLVLLAVVLTMVGSVNAIAWTRAQAIATPAPVQADTAPAKVTSRPDLVSARLAAQVQGSRVEVTSLEDEYSDTYVNADGTQTTESSLAPLRVQQAEGTWKNVDYDLQHVGGAWSPKVSPVPVSFSDGADADAASIGAGSKTVDLDWDVTLPKPTIEGPTATYDLGGGISLVLTANDSGFEQSLVLAHVPTSLPKYKLPLDLAGLTAHTDGSGGYEFDNAAGDAVYDMPAPAMWGADIDPATEQPLKYTKVSAVVSKDASGDPELDLAPSLSWLQQPDLTYPVTIDPSISKVGSGTDAYVQNGLTTNTVSKNYLLAGMFGNKASRAYLRWNTLMNNITATHVISANLKLWNNGANNCTAATIRAYALSSAVNTDTVTWSGTGSAAKPTFTTTSGASASFAHGYESGGCANASDSINVTSLLQAWATSSLTYYGMQLSGTETSGAQGWEFCSMNEVNDGSSCNDDNHVPALSVTYNDIPSAASGQQIAPSVTSGSTLLTNSATPQLSAVVSDIDGGPMTYKYEVSTTASSTNDLATGSIAGTAGTRATWTVPTGKLSDGSSYYWRVYGTDGTDSGAASAWQQFTVDTTAPAAPTVSSSDWPSGSWTSNTTGTISWSASTAASFQYQVDNQPDWTTTTASSKSLTLGNNEQHTVKVEALDAAGNVSGVTSYTFGIGSGSLVHPAEGTSSAKNFLLTSAGPSSTNWVEYQWRLGSTGAFTTIPAADVTDFISGGTPGSWPWTSTSSGYVWNAARTVSGDGDLQIEACFATDASGTGSTCQSDPTDVQLSSGSFSGASASTEVGPGSLSLVTGDFSVSANDVSIEASNTTLSLSRTATTLHPAAAMTSAPGVFGPGWTASLDGPEGGAASSVVWKSNDNSYVTLTDPEGSEETYAATSSLAGSSITYAGLGDADDGSVLIYNSSSNLVTLTDADGTRTTWVFSANQWQPTSVVQTGDAAQNTSSFYYDTSGSSPTFGLPTRIVAPSPAGVDCSTLAKADSTQGCRSLIFVYASVTVGSAAVQRLAGVSLRAWNPAASSPAMQTVLIESYDYDATGHLAHEWDPRITPLLKTGYTYDSNGRLSTLTPPGLAAWTMHYDSNGRLTSVTRPNPSGATATTTVVYDVPISGGNAPIDLSYGAVTSWGQYADIPVNGTAVFQPDHVPANTSLNSLTNNGDWPFADLTYLDYVGNATNTASYGAGAWQVDSSMYDAAGDVFWQLTAGNRVQALNPTSATDPWVAAQTSSATRAAYLSTYSIYDADLNLRIQAGPMHPVTLPDGSVIDARDGRYLTYNAGAPAGQIQDLQTGESDYAYSADGRNLDVQTESIGYDPIDGGSNSGTTSGWTLGQPTAVTDPGGLSTKIRYNPAGQMVEERLPGDAGGTGPRTTASTYYVAAGSGPCTNAAFAGLLCQTSPAAQPNSGKPLPVVTYAYDMYGEVATKTETYGSGTGQVVRTTAVAYDSAQRQISSSTAVSPTSAGGTALPTVSTSYSASTGLPITASTTTSGTTTTLATGYDSLGRRTSYTDANGTQSSIAYDIDGRVTSANDGKGTTTYTYDSGTEHRGLVTNEDIGLSGSPSVFAASYDADGNMISDTYPNGLVATVTYDNTQNATNLTYAKGGNIWLSFTQARNTHGQVITQSSPESAQTFAYDGSDRLKSVQDNDYGSCVTRNYTLDADSNRTKLDSFPSSSDGSCSTSATPATQAATYDQADRIVGGGYVYDALGRTGSVAAADAQGLGAYSGVTGSLNVTYFSNDMVSSEAQGNTTETFTLDPLQNRASGYSDGTKTIINHYDDSSDSPSWISTGASTWVRETDGPDGALAVTSDQSGAAVLQLKNLHGDIVATAADSSTAVGVSGYSETTEFGAPRTPAAASVPYGFLGESQRSNDHLGGLIVMGVRLYDGNTGRFLSVDPVAGGNDNAYAYPTDPISQTDTSGRMVDPPSRGGIPLTRRFQGRASIAGVGFTFGKPSKSGLQIGTNWSIFVTLVANRVWYSVTKGQDSMTPTVWHGNGMFGTGRYALRISKKWGITIDIDAYDADSGVRTLIKLHFRRSSSDFLGDTGGR